MPEKNLIPIDIEDVCVTETTEGIAPVVVLKTKENKYMKVYVGLSEAISIDKGHRGMELKRPYSHDLIIDLLDKVGANAEKAIIDELEGGVFFAQLTLLKKGKELNIDARPSDCMALSTRCKTQLYTKPKIIEEVGKDKEEIEDLKPFHEYL
ncbi:Bifunctional nuclease with DNase and RNase activity [Methanonatronarchaeum thermophilum]|uniref:Bifunctional nuclease with DNase and RNase activity n=1 Tax=Methanonatronarchaeum thermophilum TaxID=1927129 RepID=A0A1Y3GD98_9EURY|nr:bifunctional nuclease family protein [Methanonatronarchaeum thermophilum]OUJ19220.1 Bifunctional nuclease with DNase and RNase activity [Methanonatronarchaeum thermophilum]